MLKLKLQYLGHVMQRTDSFEKTMMLGKLEGRSRRGQLDDYDDDEDDGDGWMASPAQWA